MRADTYSFAALDQATAKAPRFVAAIMYDVDSLYITSHAGIENVPGTVIEGALSEPTITSQQLNPDTATAQIGSASFGLIDLAGQFTDEVRERLLDSAGLRGRRVQFYLGYESLAFEDFVLVGTQVIEGARYDGGRYQIECLDIQRELRSEIFKLIETTLAASATATDTTLTLTSTAGLQRIAHGSSWTDAPNATVGYIKIKSEIIRYTDISGNQLTGCTRGVFGSTPAAYEINPATPVDRREKVIEYVYLELPAVKLAYAILTGQLWGSAQTLPSGWHLGIDPALVTDEDFTNIGADLWNPLDDSAGFIVRFQELKTTDGKRFIEKEICLLIGVYLPVYADGSLGLRRMIRLSESAATSLTLDESNSIQVGELQHDMTGMHNAFVVNWSWNGEEFRRATVYVDVESRAVHGEAPTHTLNFRGLFGGRHTDSVIFSMLDMVRDRFAGPPLRMQVQVLHGLNRIEIGDVVRVRYRNVRDFSRLAGDNTLDRAFEVQNISTDHRRGGVSLQLFASTAEPSVNAPTQAATSLPDSYYSSEGTALETVPGITITAGHLTAAANVLTGADSTTEAASIYYYLGDLTIDAGVTLRLAKNIQLRVRGFLQINGAIDGIGGGLLGVADDGRALPFPSSLRGEGPFATESIPGNAGYVGTVRGYDGIRTRAGVGAFIQVYATWPPHLTISRHASAPRLLVTVSGASTLTGLPEDLRGAGGGPGGRLGNSNVLPYPPEARGGPGANGGAGLLIITRGMACGANGVIDLSGAASAPTVPLIVSLGGQSLERWPGAGAGGGPGAMYVLLDGASFSVPDFSDNKFRANAGGVPVPAANALTSYRSNAWAPDDTIITGGDRIFSPMRGYPDPEFTTNAGSSYSGSAHVIQHIPSAEDVPTEDPGGDAPAPVNYVYTESIEQGINVYMGLPDLDTFDTVQLYASADNNRANAVKVAEGLFDLTTVRVPDGAVRFFWVRTKRGRVPSSFTPLDANAGVMGAALGGMRFRGTLELYATRATKLVSGAAAWDSSFWSQETYAGGVFVSFQPATLAAEFIIGLNADPESSDDYTSIDYGWAPRADGRMSIVESGTNILDLAGPYATTTVLEVRYDGQQVKYYKDGALVRSVARINATFFIDSSFYTPGASAKNLKFGPLTTAPSVPWVTRGTCTASATTIRKVGGINDWESDAYSYEAFRNGAFLSFQADQTTAALMVALNTDPLTTQDHTSLDFAWYLRSTGTADILEVGAVVYTGTAYTTSDVFSIAYDGKAVRYLKNGTLIREVPAANQTFYLDSAFATPGGAIRNLTFTPYGAATPVPFLARGYCAVSDTTAQKIGGPSAWGDSDIVSINGYPVAFAEWKCSQTNKGVLVGLNADPYTDLSYTSIDAAWYTDANGDLSIYQSGAYISTPGKYTPSTVLAITYDGASFRFYKDGAYIDSLLAPGKTVFLDGAFKDVDAAINSLRFGPGTLLAVLDTPQLRVNAATSQIQHTPANGSIPWAPISTGGPFFDTRLLAEITLTNPTPETLGADVSYKALMSLTGAESSGVSRFVFLKVTGGATYSEDSSMGNFSKYVAPDAYPRSGSVTLPLAAGATLTAQVLLGIRTNAGSYPSGPDANYRDIALTGTLIKR